MCCYKEGISVLVLAFFFSANLQIPDFGITKLDAKRKRQMRRAGEDKKGSFTGTSKKYKRKNNYNNKRKNRAARRKRNFDPYKKFSNDELLEMAQKDYDTALRYAMRTGAIISEEDFLDQMVSVRNSKGIGRKERAALDRRGINYRPSAFIGSTRAKRLKERGLDIDKVSAGSPADAALFLRDYIPLSKNNKFDSDNEFLERDRSKIARSEISRSKMVRSEINRSGRKYKRTEEKGELKIYERFLSFIKFISSKLVFFKSIFIKNAEARSSRVSGSNTGSRTSASTASDSTSTSNTTVTTDYEYTTSSESSNRMDEEDLAALEDLYSQPSMQESWDQSTASMEKGYEEHGNEIRQKRSWAMLLLAAGAFLIYLGYKQVTDTCAEKGISNPPPNPACDSTGKFILNDSAGYGMMMAGAALIMYGMHILGEVASMEDEEDEQDRRNADIDAARQRLLDAEEHRRMMQEKILKYRMRTKQIEEREEQERRNRTEEESSSSR